jgi:DNA-binding response OmpR family regulator
MRILILEDEPIIAFTLEDILLTIGCTDVRVAMNLGEATLILASEAFDAAILDVNIQGKESYPVADELARLQVPYIFATGYGDLAHPDRHRNVLTLTKPYSVQDVSDAVVRMCGPETASPG